MHQSAARLPLPLILWLFLPLIALARAERAVRAEILWDHYGVAHIFAEAEEDLFYAYGWAQMENQRRPQLQERYGRMDVAWSEAAIEFSSPVRARVLLAYGNASQQGSPHRTNQLGYMARGELEIEANLARRTTF